MPQLTQGDLQIHCAIPITDIHKFYMKIQKAHMQYFTWKERYQRK